MDATLSQFGGPPGTGGSVEVTVGDAGALLADGAVGAFLTTLLVGIVLLALAEPYAERLMAAVADDPVGSFAYGVVCLLFALLVTVLLVLTIVGILVAVPFAIATYAIWAVGSTVAFLAVGDGFLGHEDGWTKPLLLGAAVNGLLTLTGIGAIVSLCVGAAGFGAVLRDYLD